MAQLIKETNHNLIRSSGYRGICHFCTGEIEYDGQLIVIEIENADLYCLVVPIDIFSCPHCLHTMETMQIWKSVEITSELDALTRSENGTQEKGPAS